MLVNNNPLSSIYKPKQKTMNWKEKNKDYVNDSVNITSAIVIIIISLLIGCLAGNI